MLGTLGVLQLRHDSAGSCIRADRKVGGKSLLEWVVRRVTDTQRLDGVLVILPSGPAWVATAKLVPPDVPVFFASRPDPLGQVVEALKEYPAKSVVRVIVDNPFIDPVLIDRLVTTAEMHSGSDYIGYCSRDGQPAISAPVGMLVEWFRTRAIRQADGEATDPADRDQVTRYLYSHPEKFNIRLIPLPEGLDGDDVRLTVALEEDWDNAQTIYEALGPEQLDWQRIAGLLDSHPGLRQRMADLNRSVAQMAGS